MQEPPVSLLTYVVEMDHCTVETLAQEYAIQLYAPLHGILEMPSFVNLQVSYFC